MSAWTWVWTPSLVSMFVTWFRSVRMLMPSRSAHEPVSKPSASAWRTSRSHRVSRLTARRSSWVRSNRRPE